MYFSIVFLIIILHNYNVNGSICDSECSCKHDLSEDLKGEYIDCSYQPFILKTGSELPRTAYSLDLSMNNISVVESSNLLRSKGLVELFLNQNKIQEVNNVFELPELKLLDLSDNLLEFIHEDTFKGMPKLEYLNLSNNQFESFDKLAFHHLVELKEIVLNNNNIGASLRKINIFDANGFGLTHKIESISIRNININTVPENFFADAYNLKKLIISNNNITEIFEIPYTLEYLDLSDNPIRYIEMEDFSDLPALKELKLNNLQIKEIPDFVFSPLHSLVNLELERNRNLTTFSHLAFGKEVLEDADDFTLKRLSIKSCRLKTIDERLMEPFGQLTKLDLQGNFWTCDCNLLWIKKLQIPASDREQLRCASPRPLYNSKIFDLGDKYFVCRITKHVLGLTLAVCASAIACSAVAFYLVLFMPRNKTRSKFIQNMYSPSAAYTALPLGASLSFEASR
ncbi:hypothetical protein O0L34_g5261 [Tuta absoluta]|nr:hypothetical protein O0L34_g5261 [Tuta absoluta]